jgi:probable HAF family extracellular repeat protein
MRVIRLVAFAACSLTACESPTRAVDIGKASPPLAEARPGSAAAITVTALPSVGSATANGINDAGTVVGSRAEASGLSAAVKWTFTGGAWAATALAVGTGTSAYAINRYGAVVGANNGRAVLWPVAGGTSSLDCTTDVGSDRAVAINSSGIVGGSRGEGDGIGAAVVWVPGQCRMDLIGLPGGTWATVQAIDDAGVLAGYSDERTHASAAVRWTRVTGTNTWNAAEKLPDGSAAGAGGTNGAGDIVGGSCFGVAPPACHTHAVVWSYPGTSTPTDLGTLGGLVSFAYGVNSASEVVGMSNIAHNRGTYGFIWSAGTMRALNPLGRDDHSEAYGVTNALSDRSRQAVGLSSRSGTQHAVVWRIP